jgi:hypothetical protein
VETDRGGVAVYGDPCAVMILELLQNLKVDVRASFLYHLAELLRGLLVDRVLVERLRRRGLRVQIFADPTVTSGVVMNATRRIGPQPMRKTI